MANYPNSLPSLTNPTGSDYLNSPAHATQHGNANDEVTAVATKIGTGSSTPADGKYLKGTGAGTSAWTSLTTKFGFFISGTPSVENDLSWNPRVPTAQTCTTLTAYCKTAPTGSVLTIRIYNITQAQTVASLSVSAGSQTGKTTSMTNASLTEDDVLRIDVTAVGSSTAGADISAIIY